MSRHVYFELFTIALVLIGFFWAWLRMKRDWARWGGSLGWGPPPLFWMVAASVQGALLIIGLAVVGARVLGL